MATTQETVLKLKTTTARLKTKVSEHEACINKLAAHSDEFVDTYNSHVADFDKLADETVPKLKAKLKEQDAKIAELFELVEALRTSQTQDQDQDRLVQGLPMTHSYHPSLSTEKSAGILEVPKSWKSWSLPVVLSIVFLLLGLWIGAVTAPAPVGYVGMSESGAKLILAPVDADSVDPTDMLWNHGLMWKHGSTRIDPITGKQLRLNVQNWEVVETPKPGRKPNSPSRIFVGPKGDTIDTSNLW